MALSDLSALPTSDQPRTRCRIGGAGLIVALILSGNAYAAPGEDSVPVATPTPHATSIAEALRDVDSTFFGIREAAVTRLKALGSSAKPEVREAFRSGPELRRAVLSRVLAARADVDDIRSMLDALTTARDPATASALREALIEHAEETAVIVSAMRAAVTTPSRALLELDDLLARARMEALFLSRKSKSGGTGSYPGQYDVLRIDRKRAIELCLAILANEDLHRPGVFPVGSFRFLRLPDVRVSEEEVRQMAANAISELCEPGDTGYIERLKRLHDQFERQIPFRGGRRFRLPPVAQLIALELDDVVLPTLVSLGALPESEIDQRVSYHDGEGDYDNAAHLRLRMKQYREAVALFMEQIKGGRLVISFYNLACAYSRWAADTEPPLRDQLIARACDAIENSVRNGYADWPWMEEDRDLTSIRGDRRYRAIVAKMKLDYPPMLRVPSSAPTAPTEPPMPAMPPPQPVKPPR